MSNPLGWKSENQSREHEYFVFERKERWRSNPFAGENLGKGHYMGTYPANKEVWGGGHNFLFAVTKESHDLLLLLRNKADALLEGYLGGSISIVAETPCPETWEEAKVWLYVSAQLLSGGKG